MLQSEQQSERSIGRTIRSTSSPLATRQAPAAFVPGEIAGLSVPMISRERELQQLLEAVYDLLDAGGHRLITILGEPGIGKSRLAFEFRQTLEHLPDPLQAYTFTSEYQSTNQPYSLLRQIITALFGIHEDDAQHRIIQRLEEGVSNLFGAGQQEKAHFIAHLIGFDLSASPYVHGLLHDARQLRERAVQYTLQCLAAATAQYPIILILEDFHYADDSSIDVIEQFVRDGERLNLLTVCLAQQRLLERRPQWAADLPTATSMRLQQLDERDSRRLVAEILRKAGKLSSELRNLIVNRAEGNPFYVEELIKMLIADGVIIPGEQSWQVQAGRLSRLRAPNSLSDLLRARVHALSMLERDFLVHAAIVGRNFWVDAVLHISAPLSPAVLQAVLGALESQALIVRQPTSRLRNEQEYSFRHELLYEVAYEQMSGPQHVVRHRSVATWLIDHTNERTDSYAGLIAEHYERGNQPEKAGRWYVRAGVQAYETYAVSEAIDYYRRALRLLPSERPFITDRLRSYEGLGELQYATARLNDALTSFTQMRDLAFQVGNIAYESRAWAQLASVYQGKAEARSAHSCAEHAVVLAESSGDAELLGFCLISLGWAEVRMDHPQHALEMAKRAVTIFEQMQNRLYISRSLSLLGVVYEQLGDFAEAVASLEQGLAISRSLGNQPDVATRLNNLGYLANARADYAAAITYLEESLTLYREIEGRAGEIYALSNLCTALNGLQKYQAAEAAALEGIHLSETNRVTVFSDFYNDLAQAYLGQNRVMEAVEAAQQALELAKEAESQREIAAAWRMVGITLSQTDDPQGALPCFVESVRLLTEAGADAERARSLRAWAIYELRHGDATQGRALWNEARALFEQAALPHELAQMPSEPPHI